MITVVIDEGVGVVTLDRPPVNALNEDMLAGLSAAVRQVADAPTVGAVLVRSAQQRFCAGADIDMISGYLASGEGADRMADFVRRLQAVYADLETLSVPTVAAIAGAATGGGLELALACDLRVAGRSARLGLPEVHIGLLPAAGGTQRLARTAGHATASRLILTGELVSGDQAAAMGIAGWVVPDGEVEEHAMVLARRLAGYSRNAVAASRRCIAMTPTPEGFEAEVASCRAARGSRHRPPRGRVSARWDQSR